MIAELLNNLILKTLLLYVCVLTPSTRWGFFSFELLHSHRRYKKRRQMLIWDWVKVSACAGAASN